MQSIPGDLLTLTILLFATSSIIVGFYSYYFNKATSRQKREIFLNRGGLFNGIVISVIFISGFVLTFAFSAFTIIMIALGAIKGNGLICGNLFYWIALGIFTVMSFGLYLGLKLCWGIMRSDIKISDAEATREEEPLGVKDNKN